MNQTSARRFPPQSFAHSRRVRFAPNAARFLRNDRRRFDAVEDLNMYDACAVCGDGPLIVVDADCRTTLNRCVTCGHSYHRGGAPIA